MGISGNSLADLVADMNNQVESYQPQLDLDAIPSFIYETQFQSALKWARDSVNNERPYPIKRILETLPYIQLRFEDDLEDYSGYIEQQSDAWKIGINSYHSEKRQRFTMAHEFGHLLFHKEYLSLQDGPYKEKEILWRSSLFNKVENEANVFASELLMPKNEFIEKWEDLGEDCIEDIANYFEVSTQAVRYRAYKIGVRKEY
jgi:Zn-dependent peptidase ImmA (M78 family)